MINQKALTATALNAIILNIYEKSEVILQAVLHRLSEI